MMTGGNVVRRGDVFSERGIPTGKWQSPKSAAQEVTAAWTVHAFHVSFFCCKMHCIFVISTISSIFLSLFTFQPDLKPAGVKDVLSEQKEAVELSGQYISFFGAFFKTILIRAKISDFLVALFQDKSHFALDFLLYRNFPKSQSHPSFYNVKRR